MEKSKWLHKAPILKHMVSKVVTFYYAVHFSLARRASGAQGAWKHCSWEG